jgi:hypothetical protein
MKNLSKISSLLDFHREPEVKKVCVFSRRPFIELKCF